MVPTATSWPAGSETKGMVPPHSLEGCMREESSLVSTVGRLWWLFTVEKSLDEWIVPFIASRYVSDDESMFHESR